MPGETRKSPEVNVGLGRSKDVGDGGRVDRSCLPGGNEYCPDLPDIAQQRTCQTWPFSKFRLKDGPVQILAHPEVGDISPLQALNMLE
jgi:hypothetical protein